MKKTLMFFLCLMLSSCADAAPARAEDFLAPTPQISAANRGCRCGLNDEIDYGEPLAESEAVDEEYFKDVAFLGDSRAVEILDYHVFEQTTVLGSTGLSINQWGVKQVIDSPAHPGQKVTMLEALEQIQAKACYMIVGLNELGWIYPEIFEEKLGNLIDQVRERQPQADLVLMMLYPISERGIAEMSDAKMEQIGVYNEIFKKLAREKQIYLVDTTSVVVDENGNLDENLTSDGTHLNAEGFKLWKGYVMTHTIRNENHAKVDCTLDHDDPDDGLSEQQPEDK